MNVRLAFHVCVVLALTLLGLGTAACVQTPTESPSTAVVPPVADLIIAQDGQCDYQIVLPDTTLHPDITLALDETAKIMRQMFKDNGLEVPVVKQADADSGRPSIYLGDSPVARAAGVDASALPVWTYVIKVSGKNLIIAGRDWPAPGAEDDPFFGVCLGSVKGATDFMREYCGTRFLAPGGLPGIEFLPMDRIIVPGDLDLQTTPMLVPNAGPPTTDVASIGLNLLTDVSNEYRSHTHPIAVSAEEYGKTHPEYFALINGRRLSQGPHLCYSNKDVQEIIYQDMLRSFDSGYPCYRSSAADGFRACQCDECKKLFDTESWGEKLWLLNKMWAERLMKDRPGKIIIASAYTVTEHPPESFDKFPPNLRVSCRSTEDALEEWSGRLPGGMVTYLHAWGGYHLCGYMPVRTPLYAQDVVRMFAKYNVKSVGLDSEPAIMWGLEGPTVYTYARMLDDVENGSALKLEKEYIDAAYGPAAPPMMRFFDELHHTLEIYARVFGVDDGSFQLYTRADGRTVRYLTAQTKLRLIGFLYPPELLERLESQLSQAEKVPGLSYKQKLRLALVRREFDYLNSTARVTHMYYAYLTQKTPETLDQLLSEMEKRRDIIMPWYDTEHEYRPEYYGRPIYLQQPISPDWEVYIGGWRYYQDHLLANGGGYLASPVPPFTWDIDEMRKSAVFDAKKIEATETDVPLSIDSSQWNEMPSNSLGALSFGDTPPRRPGEVKVAYDATALYLRLEGALPEEWTAPEALGRDDANIVDSESFTFLAAPDNNPARYFRFSAGPNDTSKYDAKQGFIEDSISPLFNQDDTSWNPDWKLQCEVAKDGSAWQALMVIPFSSLGVEAPTPGTEWKVNFSRRQPSPRGRGAEVSLWSSNLNTKTINDREAFGTLIFK